MAKTTVETADTPGVITGGTGGPYINPAVGNSGVETVAPYEGPKEVVYGPPPGPYILPKPPQDLPNPQQPTDTPCAGCKDPQPGTPGQVTVVQTKEVLKGADSLTEPCEVCLKIRAWLKDYWWLLLIVLLILYIFRKG